MSIILKNSQNIPPARWGSFEDVQYAIRVNAEKIYGIASKNQLLTYPLFWRLPPLDYSGNNYVGNPYNLTSDFEGYHYDGAADRSIFFGDILALGDIDWSLSALVKLNSVANNIVIVGKGKNELGGIANGLEYGLQFAAGLGFRALISNQITLESVVATTTGIPDLNRLYKVTVTHDSINSKLHIYVNGKYENTKSLGINQNQSTGGFNIGSWPLVSEVDRPWNGVIIDVCLVKGIICDKTISLLNELPYGLYQKVSKPIYYAAPSVGWTGIISGITNPTKINSVAATNIAKVIGQ